MNIQISILNDNATDSIEFEEFAAGLSLISVVTDVIVLAPFRAMISINDDDCKNLFTRYMCLSCLIINYFLEQIYIFYVSNLIVGFVATPYSVSKK